ncbi:MAG TPA: thioesterase, partial [Bacteroidales bacterium]|nr:thioesterase [Bacteroidales bacterium]
LESIFEEDLYVTAYNTDSNGWLNIYSLFNFLQEAGGNHAKKLGVGFNSMQTEGVFWALSRIKVIINALPKWGDTIHLQTWPKGVDKLFFMRDFILTDKSNQPIITATSAWIVVDVNKRRPLKPQTIDYSMPDNHGKFAIREIPGKLTSPITNPLFRYERNVSINEIDVNKHVNNAHYVQWLMDCFDLSYVSSHQLASIQINYLEEMKYGDKVSIFTATNDVSDQLYIEGAKTSDHSKAFQALTEWKKLD